MRRHKPSKLDVAILLNQWLFYLTFSYKFPKTGRSGNFIGSESRYGVLSQFPSFFPLRRGSYSKPKKDLRISREGND